jgi:uncharacterized protein YyaL (SSP411 family)
MPNRLSEATSPYLLQHADNPVEWHEWGPAAFEEAAERDVPILLSVGYASCHWCHVMAHESFEDETTAAVMNDLFVNVKVDREERPDVDRIYMDAVQTMTGHGGWPMTVFLTPDGRPFFAGTYFPAVERASHPSFRTVMEAIDEAWRTRRDDIETQAGRLTQAVATAVTPVEQLDESSLGLAHEQIRAAFDEHHGGFGGAPKFPQAPVLEFLLRSLGRRWAPDAGAMLHGTLVAMARGGIHDMLGGGFSRYAVDDRWLVPHFEKMLYDNAQLARTYALASTALDAPELAEVATTTLDYMLRDLGLPGGGFASGEDADSEGVEGKFYVFTHEEFTSVTDDAAVAAVLGVTPAGNFEGKSIIHRARLVSEVAAEKGRTTTDIERELGRTLAALRRIRDDRVRPGLDDKVVCAWNGLAIRAFADVGRILGEQRHIATARRTAGFVLENMRDGGGRLQRSWRDGRTSGPGFCDDYGALAVGLFALYAATGEPRWYRSAEEITRSMIDLFWDDDHGGFHATGSDAEKLIARPKNVFDNPTPSDNSLAAEALQHLAAYTGDPAVQDRLDATLKVAGRLVQRYPMGAGQALAVLATEAGPPLEVAIVGTPERRSELVDVVNARYRPDVFLAIGDGEQDGEVPLLLDRPAPEGRAAYVCRGFVCDAPVTTPDALAEALA